MNAPTGECRVCHRPLTRSSGIGPVCLRREKTAAGLPARPTTRATTRPRTTHRHPAHPIPGQTELDLNQENP